MARNRVQFQKGLSENAFDDLCGTEEKCRAAIFAWRWPDGFVCLRCGGRSYSLIRTRALYQCSTNLPPERLAGHSLAPSSTDVSDGLDCFMAVTAVGCVHQPIRTGSGRKSAAHPAFKWVNPTPGNIKAALTCTYRAIRAKHVPRYLAEFEYRFNRRYDLNAMIPRLAWASVRTPPTPYRLLKLAEAHA